MYAELFLIRWCGAHWNVLLLGYELKVLLKKFDKTHSSGLDRHQSLLEFGKIISVRNVVNFRNFTFLFLLQSSDLSVRIYF